MTYYEELEVLPTASPEVIRMAYKALARKYHPDIYKGDKVFAQEKMTRINEAYSVLSSPIQRQEYDRTLHQKTEKTEQYSQPQRPNSAQQSSTTKKSQSAQQSSTTQKSQSAQQSSTTQKSQSTQQSSTTQKSQSAQQSSTTQKSQSAQQSSTKAENATTQKKFPFIRILYVLFYVILGILLGVSAFYIDDLTIIFVGLFCIAQCIYYPYWVKSEKRTKDQLLATACFVFSNFVLIASFWYIVSTNNLLWYGQHKENSYVEMNINTSVVEKTSFLYLINQFDSESSVEDVIKIMGMDYKVPDYGGYVMEYATPQYKLDGNESTFIHLEFNSRKTKILSIKWAYRAPSQSQFSHTLVYLQKNALGNPKSVSSNKADWTGLHLEDTGYFLLFIRKF